MPLPTYESRECATLGTHFRDIYKDGVLFACQVAKDTAEWAIRNPWIFGGNVGAPVEYLRQMILELDYEYSSKESP